jgi:hypothetical protein
MILWLHRQDVEMGQEVASLDQAGKAMDHGEIMGRSWENHGKTMGKPWENHGKMVIYMENHHV